MIEGKTRKETIRLTAQALGISELEAEFIVAIECGEISGDVEVLEEETPGAAAPTARVKGSRPRHQAASERRR